MKRKTNPIKKTLNPSWGNTTSIRIPISAFNYKHGAETDKPEMKVEVWDWDKASKDDFMGTVSVPLAELLSRKDGSGKPRELEVKSQALVGRSKSDRVAGTVSFKITFVPYQ